ncbi:MAG: chemotaxis response regulator protein-glutamate methylesterase [Methylococcaceae bacterium]|nr:MAG: chemotaxis response regulator protein-glutamate methylesterase [Methylococcaceae bacterium]
MTIRVLVVDDSSFIRKRVAEILDYEEDIEVIAYAADGAEAVRKTLEYKPDVITMDVEMPVMDGISATAQIMRECPTPILMFSVSTQSGAKATLDALEAGAMDFLPKQLHEINGDVEIAKRLLRVRVQGLGAQSARLKQQHQRRMPAPAATAPPPVMPSPAPAPRARAARVIMPPLPLVKVPPPQPSLPDVTAKPGRYQRNSLRDLRLVAIASSTGGPVALQKVLLDIPANFRTPILLVQHMPGSFTKSFADRLNQICKIRVKEAEHGEEIKPGVAYLGPGGFQMELSEGVRKTLVIRESREGENYRPCADVTFNSIAKNFSGKVLAAVLTGMGSDGRLGAEKLKAAGASVWAQNEESCIVYGMPKAIVDGNLADAVFDLDEMAAELKSL